MNESWFDDWDANYLNDALIGECNKAIEGSPIEASGIVCGPILRLISVDYKRLLYIGSILLVTKNLGPSSPPTIRYLIGPSKKRTSEHDLKSGNFGSKLFYTDELLADEFHFFRYSIELPLVTYEQMVKYEIDGKFQPQYRFFIPADNTNFNSIAYSCNGFSLSVNTTTFKGSLWYDILRKHTKIHYNVMLGGGDQIYSDSIKLYSAKVKKWAETKDLVKKYSMKVTPDVQLEIYNFYLQEYIEWFGYGHWHGSTPESMTTQRCFPIAMCTIPSINIWDDHDIIDGFGSYNDTFMKTDIFSSIGKAAYKYYMLFQHHSNMDGSDDEHYLQNSNWILGHKPGVYIGEKSHSLFTRLGPNIGLLGLDCRTERKRKEIVSPETYDTVFYRLTEEIARQPKLDHLLVMLGVPIAYPRMVWLEWMFSSPLLAPLKWLSKKGIIARGLVNEFNGEVELLDDLDDHWCARHHKRERNYLMARLQDFSARHGVRISILSGDVHLASVGRFTAKLHRRHLFGNKRIEEENKKVLSEPENDVRLMFNIISSAVVNTPPPDGMARFLQARGTKVHHFDYETEEDCVAIFRTDVDGVLNRKASCFSNRRNWSDIIPVENVFNNEYLQSKLNLNINDYILPGIIDEVKGKAVLKKESKSEITKKNQAYPVTKRGIFATIHVEKNCENKSSDTVPYMLPIPELREYKKKLSHYGMKHLE
ncbi:hypothetical protein KAFR_0D01930 [Kazachstania africana CBS 2517]|uniref:PhoD-like phosphatase domain-containing protein n=1 Tax=Kazachstania africana (strain ATCC 22294 / BCRC 22015 / CBS 2517 / CECT 1963 / NBRC 1671 / NRRL Y-8276) TaxID=1071382 RepID=H2ATZ0_KAZAF|nr:hypothetical protein KAFR_0D01930 [Kazachstania africana CBS 2517]CCF57840.1 hypothetical protein KAFR_0D01930 [Kazachstania africana CBS 2517]